MSINNILNPNNYCPIYIKCLQGVDGEMEINNTDVTIKQDLYVDGVIHGNIEPSPGTIDPSSLTPGNPGQVLQTDMTDNVIWTDLPFGTGTVTNVGIISNNGITSNIINPTTTPAITLGLTDITPNSITSVGPIIGSNLTGTNTGDQTITLNGDVTGSGTNTFATTISNNAITTNKLDDSSVTYVKIQNMNANTIMANPTNISAPPSEITLGTNLSFVGNVLNATSGGSGTVTNVSITSNNGITNTIINPTTTPAITLGLNNITPNSITAVGTITGSNLSGTNTGDQTITLTNDVTGSGKGSFSTTISNNAVTYNKMQNVSALKLLGNPTNVITTPSEITLGTNLSFSGNVLNAISGGGGFTNATTKVTIFPSNGTFFKSATCLYALICCIGAGGGGGGCAGGASGSCSSGGGGSGGLSISFYNTVNIPSSVGITIGTGGSGGLNTGTNGNSGTSTIFGSLISTNGGSGGIGATSSTNFISSKGGTGALSGTGQIVCPGNDGYYGISFGTNGASIPGYGAPPPFFGGGGSNFGSSSGYGCGGSGTTTTTTGSAGISGRNGYCFVIEYLYS